MSNRDMQNWARSDQATRFFNKQLPNLIQALNNNTQAVNTLLKVQKPEPVKPAPKPNEDNK
jgi:ABC-type transporter Mla subunit MlaD